MPPVPALPVMLPFEPPAVHARAVQTTTAPARARLAASPTHIPAAAWPTARGEAYLTYVVRPGDTLGAIAAARGLSGAALARANGVDEHAILRPGQALAVPQVRGGERSAQQRSRSRAAGARTVVVIVRPGDSVSVIAARYGVSSASVLKANGLPRSATIHAGQRLRVVGTTAPIDPAPAGVDRRVSSSASVNRRYLSRRDVPSRSEVRHLIATTADRHGVDRRLALAVGWQESRWNQRSVSGRNAIGVMQCLPSTGRWMSEVLGRELDLLDARDNITCGVALLRTLAANTSREQTVLAAYYQGLASVREHGPFADTRAYVAAVQRHRDRM